MYINSIGLGAVQQTISAADQAIISVYLAANQSKFTGMNKAQIADALNAASAVPNVQIGTPAPTGVSSIDAQVLERFLLDHLTQVCGISDADNAIISGTQTTRAQFASTYKYKLERLQCSRLPTVDITTNVQGDLALIAGSGVASPIEVQTLASQAVPVSAPGPQVTLQIPGWAQQFPANGLSQPMWLEEADVPDQPAPAAPTS